MKNWENQVRLLLAKASDDVKSEQGVSEAPPQSKTAKSLTGRAFWNFSRLTGIFTTLIFCGQFSYDVAKAWATLEGVIPAYVRWVDAVGAAYTNQQLVALMIFSLVIGSAMGGAFRRALK